MNISAVQNVQNHDLWSLIYFCEVCLVGPGRRRVRRQWSGDCIFL